MTEPNGTKDSVCDDDGLTKMDAGVPNPEPLEMTLTNGATDASCGSEVIGNVETNSVEVEPSTGPLPAEVATICHTNKSPDLPNGGVCKSFLKGKNYKAGSKINQLAAMLAKRSQNFVEASQNGVTSLITSSVDPAPCNEHNTPEKVPEPPAEKPSLSPMPLPVEPVASSPIALKDSEISTNARFVKTRTSPRGKVEADSQQTDSVVKRGKTKMQRKSKQLVEMSTQTADIQFISVRTEAEISSLPLPTSSERFVCLYCHSTFSERRDCKDHELSHSQKRKTKCIKCQFCSIKLPNLEELKLHAVKTHSNLYHFCQECDVRFIDDKSLAEHNSLEHVKPTETIVRFLDEASLADDNSVGPLKPNETTHEKIPLMSSKKTKLCPALNVDVSFEGGKKPTSSPRSGQRLSPRERTDEQYEAEMLFYSHLSGNIRENLSKHLDGKIDQADVSISELTDSIRAKTSNLLSLISSTTAATPICRAPSPYQTRSKTPNPLPMSAKKFKKLPNWQQKFWEKYNFPTSYRYEHRFWDKNYLNIEKSSLYLKDLSGLDIKTQLTMRENSKKLEESNSLRENAEDEECLSFPYFLNLMPSQVVDSSATEAVVTPALDTAAPPAKKGKGKRKSRPSGQGSVVTRLQSGGESVRQRKGSLDLSTSKKVSLRRQTSLENLEGKKQLPVVAVEEPPSQANKEPETSEGTTLETSEITGEWVRPRSYLCGACFQRFNNLWELEDHKWNSHPNVWCNHYEFEDDKLKNVFKLEGTSPQVPQIKLPDLYRRYLEPQGALNSAEAQPIVSFPQACSKCKKNCANIADLHKHMLDCGGDTTWSQTMFSSPNPNMKRKWRPYGSRRRKQIGRRCVKRSMPSTPVPPRSYNTQHRVRTKPGDVETIQKMLANLPEKRTRRAINFDEINTRSQTTIQSNRLLRKRFNTTFTSNFLRKKTLTRMRLNPKSKFYSENGSKASSSSSSDVDRTPIATPPLRKKYRLKEVKVDLSRVNVGESTRKETVAKKTEPKNKRLPVSDDLPTTEVKPTLKIEKRKAAVRQKADMVKRIKKKLRNSKRILEARQEKDGNTRRSVRKKVNPVKDLPAAIETETSEEVTPETIEQNSEQPPTTKAIRRRAKVIRGSLKKQGKPKVAENKLDDVNESSLEDVPLASKRLELAESGLNEAADNSKSEAPIAANKVIRRRAKGVRGFVKRRRTPKIADVKPEVASSGSPDDVPVATDAPDLTEVDLIGGEVASRVETEIVAKAKVIRKRAKVWRGLLKRRRKPKVVKKEVDVVDDLDDVPLAAHLQSLTDVNVSKLNVPKAVLPTVQQLNTAGVSMEKANVVRGSRRAKSSVAAQKMYCVDNAASMTADPMAEESRTENRSPRKTIANHDVTKSDAVVNTVNVIEGLSPNHKRLVRGNVNEDNADIVPVVSIRNVALIEINMVRKCKRPVRKRGNAKLNSSVIIDPGVEADLGLKIDSKSTEVTEEVLEPSDEVKNVAKKRFTKKETVIVADTIETGPILTLNDTLTAESVAERRSSSRLSKPKATAPSVSNLGTVTSNVLDVKVESEEDDDVKEFVPPNEPVNLLPNPNAKAFGSNTNLSTQSLKTDDEESTMSRPTQRTSRGRISSLDVSVGKLNKEEELDSADNSSVSLAAMKEKQPRNTRSSFEGSLEDLTIVSQISEKKPTEPNRRSPRGGKMFNSPSVTVEVPSDAPVSKESLEDATEEAGAPCITELAIKAPVKNVKGTKKRRGFCKQKITKQLVVAPSNEPIINNSSEAEIVSVEPLVIESTLIPSASKPDNKKNKVVKRIIRRRRGWSKRAVKKTLRSDEMSTTADVTTELKMPVLEKAEDLEKLKESVADEEVPILKPFEDVEEKQHTLVRFKIVKKPKKNSFSKAAKVSPLKIVKEKACVEPLVASRTRRAISDQIMASDPVVVNTETDESSSDCVPLSSLQKEPLPLVKSGENDATADVASAQCVPVTDNTTSDASEVIPPSMSIHEAMVEKIIADKLNEGRTKKHRDASSHKRGKKHELKRLRMTVTLKEATLKVLDKPATPLNPCKWTVGTPTETMNFEVPATVESPLALKIFPELSQSLIVSPPLPLKTKEEELANKDAACVSNSVAKEVNSTVLGQKASVVPEKVIDEPQEKVLTEATEHSTVNDAVICEAPGSSGSASVEEMWQPDQRIRLSSRKFSLSTMPEVNEPATSAVEVSTTQSIVSQGVFSAVSDVYKPSIELCEPSSFPIDLSMDKTVKRSPVLTVEEATSSEDGVSKKVEAEKTESFIAEAPKIVEADSSAMGDDEPSTNECKPSVSVDNNVDMEPVVSSTGPAIPRKKRRTRTLMPAAEVSEEVPSTTLLVPEELDRRSRRRSKEVPRTNEFIIDDPLILVDELWSELDSDSDSRQKRKVKKVRKRVPKKKDTGTNDVDLEALLRNFGANKPSEGKEVSEVKQHVKCLRRKEDGFVGPTSRQQIERTVVIKEKAYKRLSLRLFTFNNRGLRYGHNGCKLLKVKKILCDTVIVPKLLHSPEITEQPEQVIVCRSTKIKPKKLVQAVESKVDTNVQLKVSLPLDLLGDLSMLNNNNGRERTENLNMLESPNIVVETCSRPITPDLKLDEPKQVRSDVIDKIFSCDICKTYYYTASHLKNHKMSNRHKLKEAEIGGSEEAEVVPAEPVIVTPTETPKPAVDEEKSSEDTSEMPVLEGPFIETGSEPRTDPTPKRSLFGFSEESLKDFQKAIGCTDEEMLILSLLGENAAGEQVKIDVEKRVKFDSANTVKGNGSLQSNLKQRMTSALAGLVNRAVSNLLKKSEADSPSARNEKAAFLSKLSELNDRKQKTLLQLARIHDEPVLPSEIKEKHLPPMLQGRYKYQCTICGNRFEKESTRDYHLIRTHHQGKRSKLSSSARSQIDDLTPPSDDWNDSWLDIDDQDQCESPPTQFWCSDCGINFTSPKEVRDHQRLEHPPSTAEDSPRVRTPVPKRSDLDPDQEKLIANQELQKLSARRYSRRFKGNQTMWGSNSLKFKSSKTEGDSNDTSLAKETQDRFKKIVVNNMKRKAVEDGLMEENALDGSAWKPKKSMDVYDFDSESDVEPVSFSQLRKPIALTAAKTSDEDSEDNIPLSSVKVPAKSVELIEDATPTENVESNDNGVDCSQVLPAEVEVPQVNPESFKISLESRLLKLDEISLKKITPPPSPVNDCDTSKTLDYGTNSSSSITNRRASEESLFRADSDDQINENVIYQRNDSESSYDSHDNDESNGRVSESDESSTHSEPEPEESTVSERRTKKIVPLLTATLTNSVRYSESPIPDKEAIVKKIWSRQRSGRMIGGTDESQSSEIDKETIMKRIWKKKRAEAEEEEKRLEALKIKQTEVSDEVVIKCGPKPKAINRRKSANDTAKDMIVSRIWSGKCGFQTKAALKTYESDIVPEVVTPAKRRGRPASMSNVKRKRVVSASEDDLDSLLEEIEQENVEKAIRLEFLHLRRSEKSQVDNSKEPAGLFTETTAAASPEKKRRKIKRNVGVLKRREDLAELRNRKHRRHRHHHHEHHHRKHKHKKSRHHKRILSKHKSKNKSGPAGGIKVLERMCEDIASRGDSEPTSRSVSAGRVADSRVSTDLDNLDSKIDEVLAPLATFGNRVNGEMSQTFPSDDESNQCSSNKEL